MMKVSNIKFIPIIATLFASTLLSCKKFIEVEPPVTSVTGDNVYNSDATAISVLNGLYTRISGAAYPADFDLSTLSFPLGLSADELTLWSGVSSEIQSAFYTNALFANQSSSAGVEYWTRFYSNIYICNSAIEGLANSTHLTPVVKAQLTGESKFMRALTYFYLVNLYGDVPLIVGTDYKINSELGRTTKTEVYQLILADLKEAQDLLSENYRDLSLLNESTERVRPTKWAASALLARVYLYNKEWANAEAAATQVIDQSSFYGLPALNEVFLANSSEAIWQLQPVTTGYVTNTWDGKLFVLPSSGPNTDQPTYLSPQLLSAFENGDLRRVEWVNSVTADNETFYYPYKYRVSEPDAPVSEFTMVFRLAEQYLIRAEARAQQGNVAASQDDLNKIRTRAGLGNTPAADKASLLTAILHERQVELFTESGHRWLDLKRTGTVDAVMSLVTSQKGGTWNINWQWYPISFSDIQKNRNITQNTGY